MKLTFIRIISFLLVSILLIFNFKLHFVLSLSVNMLIAKYFFLQLKELSPKKISPILVSITVEILFWN